MLELLSDPQQWERFYAYKASLACPHGDLQQLRDFIDRADYLPVCAAIADGAPFPLPHRAVIAKMGSQKKRVVYTYPAAENTVLKLLTHLLLRKYDGLFSAGLYSFRPQRTAKDAVRMLLRTPGTRQMAAYKADISNYFNSASVPLLCAMLADVLADDPPLAAFLQQLLREPAVLERGERICEQKGMMAGTPLSAFYANLYLRELDAKFAARGIPYARYSDDIILFAPTREAAEQYAAEVRQFLTEKQLMLNPEKECFFPPEEGWVYLGFRVCGSTVDLAPASLQKIKAKMRRKTRALLRWRQRCGVSGEKAAAAFIRIFNRKLLEDPGGNDLSWGRWYFPVITTPESLRAIDCYAQDCIRCLISGTHTKARFAVRYPDLKALGYRSLVHAYYADRTQPAP